jgi:hypothetical protein
LLRDKRFGCDALAALVALVALVALAALAALVVLVAPVVPMGLLFLRARTDALPLAALKATQAAIFLSLAIFALARFERTPHALHSVLSPSGPHLHMGVFVVRQASLEQTRWTDIVIRATGLNSAMFYPQCYFL